MSANPLPYRGRQVALATMHCKEEAIAPALMAVLGLCVVSAPTLDTDQLGTFAGEIPRRGTMLDTAIAKARMGMQATKLSLGIASEGSFGPHPLIPFLPGGIELMVFIDDDRDIVVHETLVADETNFSHLVVAPADAIDDFLARVGFPAHGLIVRPSLQPSVGADAGTNQLNQINIIKGITTRAALDAAIESAAHVSPDRKAHIETDMRAHMNPTRMRSLATLAAQLGQRLAAECTACGAPGWGRTNVVKGLTCEECGTPTEMVLTEVFACVACAYREDRPRRDGLRFASPAQCPWCNP